MTKLQKKALSVVLISLLHFVSITLVTVWDWVFWALGIVGICLFILFGEGYGE